jgi:uncharacterized protein YjiS (DUF1127 family)
MKFTDIIPDDELAEVAQRRGMTIDEAIGDDAETIAEWHLMKQERGELEPFSHDLRRRFAVETNPALTDEDLKDI